MCATARERGEGEETSRTSMTSARPRTSTCWGILASTSLLISFFSSGGAFKVTVPTVYVVAARHHTIVLGCVFSPDSSQSLSSLVVTWQRQEDSRVVHSFYYNKDQLERQSEDYWNRTALFHTELGKGNASLRMTDVRLGDAGRYQCMVSTSTGTDRAELQLDYGALYTEPRLSISLSATEVKMLYEAEGYPNPEVSWLNTEGQHLSHQTEITKGQDTGLLYLKSSYVTQTPAQNVTFVLKNQLLNQDLKRQVSLNCAGGCTSAVIIAVVCSLLCSMIIGLFIGWCYWHKKK